MFTSIYSICFANWDQTWQIKSKPANSGHDFSANFGIGNMPGLQVWIGVGLKTDLKKNCPI